LHHATPETAGLDSRDSNGLAVKARGRDAFAICLLLEVSPMELCERDFVFANTHCAAPLVFDAAAAGLALNCQVCGKSNSVPQRYALEQRESCLRFLPSFSAGSTS